MSIRATSPYTIYLDADGNPLTGGYVYFGVAGANPETTPIATYWDESLTIPAAQPLRTINGFIVRNGSPGTIYTAAAYSVTVKNKNGVLVFSALTNPGIPFSLAMLPVCSAATLAAGLTAFGFSAFIQSLIDDASAAVARATLGAVGLTGAEAIAGVKTFSDGIIADVTGDLTGNADTADEADGVRETGAGAALLKCKVVEIGDWNMVSTAALQVAHGMADYTTIRDIRVLVRADAGTPPYYAAHLGGDQMDIVAYAGPTEIYMTRTTGGIFDGVAFDSTSYNRGWITIWYAV